ncbi:MAG: NAD-dependent epimerase/dehydratase family protein [Candidatus Heimdallarchaeota archaeon]
MAILVTGGTGFLGGELVKQMVTNKKWGIKKEDIFVLIRENSDIDTLKKLGVEFKIGDLGKPETLAKAVKGINTIYHLGAVVLDQVSIEMVQKINVKGTQALIDAFVKEKTAKKFVFVSTWGVYGYDVSSKPMTEEQPFQPTNDYHKSKLAAELIVWDYHKKYNLPVATARFPSILGPGDTLTSTRVVQGFFENKIKRIGNGKNISSAVHVVDAVNALITMGLNGDTSEAYNVKSYDLSQLDYWGTFKEEINYQKKIPVFPYWLAYLYAWSKEIGAKMKGKRQPTLTRNRAKRYGKTRILDISKIKEKLDWKPIHTDGAQVIRDSVQWLKDNDFIDLEKKEVKLLRKWEDDLKKTS